MKNITIATASCDGDSSEVVLYNNETQQTIMMTFTRNNGTNETYLKSIHVEYNVTSHVFPNLNISGK